MNHSIIPLLCSFLLLSASSSSAFNITNILSQYPDYSNFNDLLSKTGLANEINTKTTITLLAIPNGAIGDLTSKPNDVVKNILTTHVVLDYYDTMKLQNLKDRTTKLTTMFQQTGKAVNDQGFLNVTANKDNAVVFGSSVVGAPRDSRLDKSVMNQPYNISILGISQPIVTPGLDSPLAPSSSAPPVNANTPKNPSTLAPSSTPPVNANTPKSPSTLAPSSAPPANANTPKILPPKAESPASSKNADSPSTKLPTADAKSPSSSSKNADSPSADSPLADAQAPSSSSAEKLKVSIGLFVMFASMFVAY